VCVPVKLVEIAPTTVHRLGVGRRVRDFSTNPQWTKTDVDRVTEEPRVGQLQHSGSGTLCGHVPRSARAADEEVWMLTEVRSNLIGSFGDGRDPLGEVVTADVVKLSIPEDKAAARNVDVYFGFLEISGDGRVSFGSPEADQVGLLGIPLLGCHFQCGEDCDLATVGYTPFTDDSSAIGHELHVVVPGAEVDRVHSPRFEVVICAGEEQCVAVDFDGSRSQGGRRGA